MTIALMVHTYRRNFMQKQHYIMVYIKGYTLIIVLAIILGFIINLMYCSQEINEKYMKKIDFTRSKKLRSYTISSLHKVGCDGLLEPCLPFMPSLTHCEGSCEPGLTKKSCRLFKKHFRCVRVPV